MSNGLKRRDGFPGERLINIPLKILRDAKDRKPILFNTYITQIGYFPQASHHYRERRNGCEDNILIYCIRGKGHYILDKKRYEVNAGQYVIIPATDRYIRYWADTESPWTIYWIHFTGDQIGEFNRSLNLTTTKGPIPIPFNDTGIEVWQKIFSILSVSFRMESLCNANFCLQHLISTFLYPQHEDKEKEIPVENSIQQAIDIMKSNLHLKLSLEEIAVKVNLSTSYFATFFKKRQGISPIDYFINMKMQRACELLRDQNNKVREVASDIGYEDPYYFSRIFKNVVGLSPAQYRKDIQ
ncbi:AraC family transcriptional regulator [Mucilaginibacter rubeus]|uniref:AraC family transcriptional regulator n=1 Tax=Mucilaginibacter rubeus TaxID=2027860 RepID=A0A5C1I1C4_9SPHI|nr:AraC family transcriptional regulator [Mucilaginibacter rubeus]QEM11713.1 AraC family transcriptional regulator [Mucilaginibacter rubeus]